MFRKLRHASKAPFKLSFEVSIDTVDHLPLPYGKVKVIWCRGDSRSGHWHETSPYHVTNGSARIKESFQQTLTLYKDAKGVLDSKKYELKIQQCNLADGGDKPLTVASLDLDMAQYATAGQRKAVSLRLPLRENPAYSVLHGEVLLKLAIECLVSKDKGGEADDVSIASGLTSEASTIQEQDLSGFLEYNATRASQPAAASRAAISSASAATYKTATDEHDRQLLFTARQSPLPIRPGTMPAALLSSPAPVMRFSRQEGAAQQAAPGSASSAATVQDKGGMQLDAAQVSVVPQHKSQWSLAAAALDLDREEETLALKQERDSLSTHLEELQASCKSTARVHEQQLSALKAQIAELEAQLAWQDQVEQDWGEDLRMAHARAADLEGKLRSAQTKQADAANDELIEEAEAKVMAAQACILDLQEQLQAALLRPPQHPADSRQPDTPSGEGVQVAVLEQQLLAVQQELAQAETAHMSRTLSDELGLSATQAQALRVSTLQASLERERSASKHQVTNLEVELEQLEAELEHEKAQSRDKVAALEAANKAAQQQASVLEAHLDQLIGQVSHVEAGKALQTEVEHLRAVLASERASVEQQQRGASKRLAEAEDQLNSLGAELLDARAAAQEQAAGQQAEVSRLQQCLAEERAATTRLALFEAEVGQLEFALAAEKASASDYRANLEAQVEALQLAISSATRRISVADARTSITPQASMRQSTTSVQDEATSPLAPAAAFQEEDFLEHPRAIALQSQLSILRRTINALQRSQAASEQGFSIKLEQEQHDSLQRVAHLESQLAKKEQEISQVSKMQQQLAAELHTAVQRAERAEGHPSSALRAGQDSAEHHAQERQQLIGEVSELQSAPEVLQCNQALARTAQLSGQVSTAGLSVRELKVDDVPGVHLRNGLSSSIAVQSEQLLRELGEAGQQLQDQDAIVLGLRVELQKERLRSASAGEGNGEAELVSLRRNHSTALEQLHLQIEEAQQRSALVSAELDTQKAQLTDAKAENALLAQKLQAETTQDQGSNMPAGTHTSDVVQAISEADAKNQLLEFEVQVLRQQILKGSAGQPSSDQQAEVAALRKQCAAMEARAITELDGMHEELLEMREACVHLEQALADSEARRERLRSDKHTVEQQLQVTAGELMEAERGLSSASSSSQASFCTGVSGLNHEAQAVHAAMDQARSAEVDSIMLELVTKKMELAELHEANIKLTRELRWTQQQSIAAEAKLAKLETIAFSTHSAKAYVTDPGLIAAVPLQAAS